MRQDVNSPQLGSLLNSSSGYAMCVLPSHVYLTALFVFYSHHAEHGSAMQQPMCLKEPLYFLWGLMMGCLYWVHSSLRTLSQLLQIP